MQTYNVSRLPSMIKIGWDGENLWRPQAFDCSVLLANHPNGVITLWLLPNGETDAFPVALERDGNMAVWTPTSAELVVKMGQLQLMCVDGVAVGKSAVVYYQRSDSLVPGEASDTPSWAVQVVQDVNTAASHYPKIENGYWWVWDVDDGEWVNTNVRASGGDIDPSDIADAVEDYMEDHPLVETDPTVSAWAKQPTKPTYTAAEVHALSDTTVIPDAVTEQTVSGWGFTKNTGTYSKPNTGIPATDLASDVQTSLGKADTALQTAPVASVNSKTGAVVLKTSDLTNDSGFQTAPFEIPITQSGSTYTTTATAADILANADNCVAVVGGVARLTPDYVGVSGTTALLVFGYIYVQSPTAPDEVFAVLVENNSVTVSHASRDVKDLPTVTASDNGKFLRVVNGAWAAATVPSAESNSFGGGA